MFLTHTLFISYYIIALLHVYMKKDLFTLRYMDIDEEGNDVVLQTRQVRYKDTVSLDYVPEEGHGQDRFGDGTGTRLWPGTGIL